LECERIRGSGRGSSSGGSIIISGALDWGIGIAGQMSIHGTVEELFLLGWASSCFLSKGLQVSKDCMVEGLLSGTFSGGGRIILGLQHVINLVVESFLSGYLAILDSIVQLDSLIDIGGHVSLG